MLRVHYSEGESHRNGSVHGVPALLEHIQSHLRRQRMDRGHGPVSATRDLFSGAARRLAADKSHEPDETDDSKARAHRYCVVGSVFGATLARTFAATSGGKPAWLSALSALAGFFAFNVR